jgi:antitoxin VapB
VTALNIKNEHTYELARKLADITGESLTEAVTQAVRERLARVERPDPAERLRRIQAIAERSAPLFKEPFRSVDHGDLLYDDAGLPK